MTATEVIQLLGLEPLEEEGGYYKQTFKSPARVTSGDLNRSAVTAIYYLVTPQSFSSLHRLTSDEVFSFYLGDPVEMFQISETGALTRHVLGPDLRGGQSPQVTVPRNCWQGSRLAPGGQWALLGTVVAPGFEFDDFEIMTEQYLHELGTLSQADRTQLLGLIKR